VEEEMERADVVVIGAGLIGSSIAWRLAQGGRRVILLDRGEPGAEASGAGAGLLQPEAGREASPETLRLWLESLAMYEEFIREVQDVTRTLFEFRICGRLVIALDEAQEAALRTRAKAQDDVGIPYEWVSGDDARRMEPALAPDVRAALFYRQHGLVDNRGLSKALALAAAMAGADVRPYEPALEITVAGGKVDGVTTVNGHIAADVVVNAAGAWSSLLAPAATGVEHRLIVGPAKGEIIALESQPRPIERVVTAPGASISARADGRIVVGATIIPGSFRKEITADGVARMIAAATRAVPCLGQARFLDAWTGLRPHSLDDQPVIGADRIAGLYWATGHYTMGILSTPATAAVVADLIEGRPPRVPIRSLSPRRFVP
jgi:glycine oxidase